MSFEKITSEHNGFNEIQNNVVDKITINTILPNNDSCIDESDKRYGNPGYNNTFLIDNLFSELASPYQRETARYNLGIADDYAMLWGNISGSIASQTDLVNYITNSIKNSIDILDTKLSTEISTDVTNLTNAINTKAPLNSPYLSGEAQSDNPDSNDVSNRIATTYWVANKLSDREYLNSFSLSPTFAFSDSVPTNVTITWAYSTNIQSQTLNGTTLDSSLRTYTYKGVNSNLYINLIYFVNGIQHTATEVFEVTNPIYYGETSDYTLCSKIRGNSLSTTVTNYLYIILDHQSEFSVNGFVGGFTYMNTVIINSNTYYVYRSDNSGLGSLTVKFT